jgi:AbrB family looped-hinge helix DNA binding protein
MATSGTISSKGQITLPIEVRRRLGVKQGDRFEFVVEDGKTTLRAVQPAENPFDKCIGALPPFKNMDEINAWVREMRDPDGEYE